MILVVGGNARNVGKTTLVCQLIAATREAEWVAVKISGHPHGDPSPRAPKAVKPPATRLFAEAGAIETHLLHDTAEDRALLAALTASGRNVIIESNRAVEWVVQDFDYVFVQDPAAENPKPESRWHLERAAWILPPREAPPADLLAAVLRKVARSSD